MFLNSLGHFESVWNPLGLLNAKPFNRRLFGFSDVTIWISLSFTNSVKNATHHLLGPTTSIQSDSASDKSLEYSFICGVGQVCDRCSNKIFRNRLEPFVAHIWFAPKYTTNTDRKSYQSNFLNFICYIDCLAFINKSVFILVTFTKHVYLCFASNRAHRANLHGKCDRCSKNSRIEMDHNTIVFFGLLRCSFSISFFGCRLSVELEK